MLGFYVAIVKMPHSNNNNISVDEASAEPIIFREANLLDIIRNGNNDQCIDRKRKYSMTEQDKSNAPSKFFNETERDSRAFDTSGSDSSPTRGKNSVARMNLDHFKGSSGFEEKADGAMHSDEKQQRKHKRTIMNDKQIALIESALVDEPDMHRNSTSLRLRADKLSLHGAEATTSRLKNWLNNRKARLVRVAKDVRGGSYQGDNTLNSANHLFMPVFSPLQERALEQRRGFMNNSLALRIDITHGVEQVLLKICSNMELLKI